MDGQSLYSSVSPVFRILPTHIVSLFKDLTLAIYICIKCGTTQCWFTCGLLSKCLEAKWFILTWQAHISHVPKLWTHVHAINQSQLMQYLTGNLILLGLSCLRCLRALNMHVTHSSTSSFWTMNTSHSYTEKHECCMMIAQQVPHTSLNMLSL